MSNQHWTGGRGSCWMFFVNLNVYQGVVRCAFQLLLSLIVESNALFSVPQPQWIPVRIRGVPAVTSRRMFWILSSCPTLSPWTRSVGFRAGFKVTRQSIEPRLHLRLLARLWCDFAYKSYPGLPRTGAWLLTLREKPAKLAWVGKRNVFK